MEYKKKLIFPAREPEGERSARMEYKNTAEENVFRQSHVKSEHAEGARG